MTASPPPTTPPAAPVAPTIRKVEALRPNSKSVNMLVKVVSVGAPKEIPSKMGGPARNVTEAIVGDETGTVIMSLWDDQSSDVTDGQLIGISNGYVTLVRGHMRLNVGRYGTKGKAEGSIENVRTDVDVSAKEYPMPERRRRFTPSGYGSAYGGSWDDISVSRERYGDRNRTGGGGTGGTRERKRW